MRKYCQNLVIGLCGMGIVTASLAQESVTFTNVNFDGTFGTNLNTVLSHTMTNSFAWGGEVSLAWTIRGAEGRTDVYGIPSVDISTPTNGSASWTLGLQTLPGFTPYRNGVNPFAPHTGARTFVLQGYSNVPYNPVGQQFDFRFFSQVDAFPPNTVNGNWQTITFTFHPYTPPVPPMTIPFDREVIHLGALTAPNGLLTLSFVQRPFDPPPDYREQHVLAIYGHDASGSLMQRFRGITSPFTLDVSTWDPGRYYIAFGDDTTEFQNRYLVQDSDDGNSYFGDLTLSNNVGTNFASYVPHSDPHVDWRSFDLIPAPGAGVALLIGCGVLTRRRRVA